MLPPFEIHQPATAAEAAALRVRFGETAALYAGGSELLLALKEGLGAFEHLIDVKTIAGLDALGLTPGGTLAIGAAVTHGTLERSAIVRQRFPLLAEMEHQVANPRVRSVGTLGGNLCFAEPHSDPPAALLVHGAAVVLEGAGGPRRLPLADFIVGPYESALGTDEILTVVEVAPPPSGAATAYLKFGMHERPTVGVAALLVPDARGRVTEARVAVGCVPPVATRLAALETALAGVSLATLEAGWPPAEQAGDALDAVSDLHGAADYKRAMAGVFVKRALVLAARRAKAAA
ncbi:MAG TPA: FAD binding domain-containing protein [Methylomirabilota bacterium]|nr:FAD binding domain-containing protein [Methylomirabilota bacterium]